VFFRPSPFRQQLLHESGNQFRVVFVDQVIDPRGRNAQLFQVCDDPFPLLCPLFALGEVKLAHKLLEPLNRDCLAILVIILDDPLLMLGVFGHWRGQFPVGSVVGHVSNAPFPVGHGGIVPHLASFRRPIVTKTCPAVKRRWWILLPPIIRIESNSAGGLARRANPYIIAVFGVKQIIAIVKPYLAEKVLEGLQRAPLEALSVREVHGFGRQKSYLDEYGESEYSHTFLPKVQISLWVENARVEEIVRRIEAAARTGRMGDGKIFILPAVSGRRAIDITSARTTGESP